MDEYDEFGNPNDEYDEFGNPVNESSDSENEIIPPNPNEELSDDESQLVKRTEDLMKFGPQVTTILPQQQTETNEPVIRPHIQRTHKIEISESNLPKTTYSRDFMVSTALSVPDRIRNIAVIGNLNSGKTSFIDQLIRKTHPEIDPIVYLDNHVLETKRGITIKSSPISLLLQSESSPSYMMNIIDTPGHINFEAETIVAMEGCESVMLVIDVVEGFTFRDKLLLDYVINHRKSLVVVLNKLDRLILDLRLPVVDSYYKLNYILDQINDYIENNHFNSDKHMNKITPKSNVIFASHYNICFTLKDFAKLYINNYLWPINEDKLVAKLWGNNYFDPSTNKFGKNTGNLQRSFVYFVLEPIYKLFTYTLTKNSQLAELLYHNFHVTLSKKMYENDSKQVLKDVMESVFDVNGLVDVIIEECVGPNSQSSCNSSNVIGQILKSIESPDGQTFYSLVRIFSGTVKVGDSFEIIEEEESRTGIIEEIHISGGRYKFSIDTLGPGFIGLIKGFDNCYNKQGFIVPIGTKTVQKKLRKFTTKSVFKVSIEPKYPKDLPSLIKILQKINKSYLSTIIKTEESGDISISGTGELIMDCILHDLRFFFAPIGTNMETGFEIKVSEPSVKLSETVGDSSITRIPIKSANTHHEISIMAEPLNNVPLSQLLQDGLDLSLPIKDVSKILVNHGLDLLESRNLWAFTSHTQPSILIDDTLKNNGFNEVKQWINSGFIWSCQEGPMIEESVIDTKFRILDLSLNQDIISSSKAQIIPMVRKACYTGILTAQPKLMEPIYEVFITCTYKVRDFFSPILDSRRGSITTTREIPGTMLYEIIGKVPVIESIGLETEIRLRSQGQAMVYLNFKNFDFVPGNPMDESVYLPDLKPVPRESIARDFLLKTRRRKGLGGEVNLRRYIDEDLYERLAVVLT